jgi:hypothetical protein
VWYLPREKMNSRFAECEESRFAEYEESRFAEYEESRFAECEESRVAECEESRVAESEEIRGCLAEWSLASHLMMDFKLSSSNLPNRASTNRADLPLRKVSIFI